MKRRLLLVWMTNSVCRCAALEVEDTTVVDVDGLEEDDVFTNNIDRLAYVDDGETSEASSIVNNSVDDSTPDLSDNAQWLLEEVLPPNDKQFQSLPADTVDEVTKVYDDRTYLDLFGEYSKEFLTRKLIPLSDPECQWNWRRGRCDPYCQCSFQPKWGDFHIGRACRRRRQSPIHSPTNHTCSEDDVDPSNIIYTSLLPTHMVRNIAERMKQQSTQVQKQISSKWDKVFESIQLQVCQDAKQRCSTIDAMANEDLEATTSNHDADPYIFAWQERLFCKEIIDDCN